MNEHLSTDDYLLAAKVLDAAGELCTPERIAEVGGLSADDMEQVHRALQDAQALAPAPFSAEIQLYDVIRIQRAYAAARTLVGAEELEKRTGHSQKDMQGTEERFSAFVEAGLQEASKRTW